MPPGRYVNRAHLKNTQHNHFRGQRLLDGYYALKIAPELDAVALRHHQHIAELIAQLRSAGLDDELIERSVDQLIASYRSELVRAMKALKGHEHA